MSTFKALYDIAKNDPVPNYDLGVLYACHYHSCDDREETTSDRYTGQSTAITL